MPRPSALTLALGLAAAVAAAGASGELRVGEPVPQLLLPDATDGRPRSLADFRGEKYVLHVFASW